MSNREEGQSRSSAILTIDQVPEIQDESIESDLSAEDNISEDRVDAKAEGIDEGNIISDDSEVGARDASKNASYEEPADDAEFEATDK